MNDHSGVLAELVSGSWREPVTEKQFDIGIKDIVTHESLEGTEAQLIHKLHAGQSITVISDERTHAALGERVYKALKADGMKVNEYIWLNPICSEVGVEHIRTATASCDVRIAVGSGTVSDTVKYASYLDDKPYSVFATSPMTAYTTATASVAFDGFKRSISCKGAQGIYFDLTVMANCPARLISAAFADVICRTTSQVDWLLSHLLLDTSYSDTPYILLAHDEANMIANADNMLAGDLNAIAMLTRTSGLMGMGTRFTGTTHSGSMAEHQISHYIDMFAGKKHPGTSHGEQVGVATATMSLLQNEVLSRSSAPILNPTRIPEQWIQDTFEHAAASNMIEQSASKALDSDTCDTINQRLETEWETIRARLHQCLLPYEKLHQAMKAANCQIVATDIGLDTEFYKEAVTAARFIRDRYSMLDFVDDSTGLDTFVSALPV